MTIRVLEATAADWPAVHALLDAAGLPTGDLGAGRMPDFIVARSDDECAGAIGVERYGRIGLLRSLVVATTARGSGLGKRLVAALEAATIAAHIEELWLLTIDADRFFADLGYAVAGRADAPASIRGTAEFSGLCPDTAVLMRKTLQRGGG